jgi:hypothetical protein
MCTAQGQAAFGHSVQAIITYSCMVKTFYKNGTRGKRCVPFLYLMGRVFSMRVEHTFYKVHTPTNRFVMNYFNLHVIPAKLSRSGKQHPSKSAHLMRRFVRGCRYMLNNSSFLLTSEPNSRRVPRVGRVGLAQAHTQAFQTPPST